MFYLQPPKTKGKKVKVKVKSSSVVDGLSTEEMSKDQVRHAAVIFTYTCIYTVFNIELI